MNLVLKMALPVPWHANVSTVTMGSVRTAVTEKQRGVEKDLVMLNKNTNDVKE